MNRIEAIRQRIEEIGTDAYLALSPADVRYFSGLVSSNIALLITKEEALVFSDGRYRYLLESQNLFDPVICNKNLYECVAQQALSLNLPRILIDPKDISLKNHQILEEELGLRITLYEDITLPLRLIKEEKEIHAIKKAQMIAEKAYCELLKTIKPGQTTREIASRLNYFMEQAGSEEAAFDTIVATGAKSANCHAVPDQDPVQEGDFLLFDFGATVDGYRSDMTRTIAIGSVSDFQKEIYDTVLEAHHLAYQKAAPGILCRELDLVARGFIEQKGYGEAFLHSLGHGVGLDIHEGPALSSKSEVVLSPGMIITIEPGIYLKDRFGVRIEDTYQVTENGASSFATLGKELLILPL